MAKITYESDRGNKLTVLVDESFIKDCNDMGIAAWQELLEVIRKEVEAEETGNQ